MSVKPKLGETKNSLKKKCGGQFKPCCWCGEVNLSAMSCNCLDQEYIEQLEYDADFEQDD